MNWLCEKATNSGKITDSRKYIIPELYYYNEYKDLICLPLWRNFNVTTYNITKKLFDYNASEKPTSFEQLINVLCKDFSTPQSGGSKQQTMLKKQYNYYIKYCKYKSAYLKLQKKVDAIKLQN